jgi:hypothetical protein
MIHAELSIEPHHKEARYENFKLAPGSPPPHVISKMEFYTWAQLHDWWDSCGFVADGMEAFWDNPQNDYVGVEIELKDVTNTLWTKACLAVEGNETVDPDWGALRTELRRAMEYLMKDEFREKPTSKVWVEEFNRSFAITNAICSQHKKEPE